MVSLDIDIVSFKTHLYVTTVIVAGHSKCGAVLASYNHVHGKPGGEPGESKLLGPLRKYLDPLIQIVFRVPESITGDKSRAISWITEENVRAQVRNVRLSDLVGSAKVHGWLYDMENGRVAEIDNNSF